MNKAAVLKLIQEQDAIDKIVSKVLKDSLVDKTGHTLTDLFRQIAKEALNEGFLAGHEIGYDEGYSVGFCEGAGTDAMS